MTIGRFRVTVLSFFFINKIDTLIIYLYIVKFSQNFLFEIENIYHFILLLSFSIYILALTSLIFNLRNILISLFFVELAYFGVIVFFLFCSIIFQVFHGVLYALVLILLAASESAVGLGIVILIYSYEKKISFENLIELV